MTTAAPSAALATIQPVFTDAERVALAGYRGLTWDAYALDLRQFTSWCRARSLALFAGMCRKPPRTRIRGRRCGMTGPAAAWTVTRPTSSPLMSQVPPGNPQGPESRRLAAAAARRRLMIVASYGPRAQREREQPLCADVSSMPIRVRIFQIRAYARTGLGWEWIAGHHSMRRGLLS